MQVSSLKFYSLMFRRTYKKLAYVIIALHFHISSLLANVTESALLWPLFCSFSYRLDCSETSRVGVL